MTVQVILKEKGTNLPIRFVKIYLEGEQCVYENSTDGLGRVSFPKVSDGKYLVKIKSPNHRPYYKKTYLSQNSILDIKLDKATL